MCSDRGRRPGKALACMDLSVCVWLTDCNRSWHGSNWNERTHESGSCSVHCIVALGGDGEGKIRRYTTAVNCGVWRGGERGIGWMGSWSGYFGQWRGQAPSRLGRRKGVDTNIDPAACASSWLLVSCPGASTSERLVAKYWLTENMAGPPGGNENTVILAVGLGRAKE